MAEETKSVLIVEDNPPIAKALTLKLKKVGYDVHHAPSGVDALEVLTDRTFDLILLDLIMPEMTGFEVLEKLKERNISIPVIVSSNLSQDSDIQRAKELGAVDYYVKSDTSIAEVVEHVQNNLK